MTEYWCWMKAKSSSSTALKRYLEKATDSLRNCAKRVPIGHCLQRWSVREAKAPQVGVQRNDFIHVPAYLWCFGSICVYFI